MKHVQDRIGAMLAVCGIVGAAGAQGVVPLAAQNWDGFELFPNAFEGVFTGPERSDDTAFFGDANDDLLGQGGAPFDGRWQQNGWRQTFADDVFGVGVGEWQGWSVADIIFWLNSDDQRRSEFVFDAQLNPSGRGFGAVAVADPDEWDDFDPTGFDPEAFGLYDTTLTSPRIPLAGVTPNTAVLQFASSWRDEDNQKVRAEVVYYNAGGAEISRTEILSWSSDPADPRGTATPSNQFGFKDDAIVEESTNELVELDLNNPADAAEAELVFEMFDAGNDWWWAIDNIIVAGEAGEPTLPPLDFVLSGQTFVEDGTPAYGWSLSIGATSYEVQIANDAAFTDLAFTATTADLSFELPQSQGLLPGVYFARVVASNPLGTATTQTIQFGVNAGCPADLNGDGLGSFGDVTRFIDLFNNQ